ncbi:hypothetical protein ACG02S_15245 [Roseateles sp. DC23W]|uniref:Ankyrin repeat-containing protein n=1 Tax=Pelomonas dachongensis TaxID=3299029 RepID=A0ABW7EP92_9BURK
MRLTPATAALLAALSFALPAARAGVNDIKPSPILNLNAGVSDELIDGIRAGRVPIETRFVMFTEEDQLHLPRRIDQRFTALCAAAHGGRAKAVKALIQLGADVNAPCIHFGWVTNPLQLAYQLPSLQGRETEVTTTLKTAGAQVSAAWRDMAANERALAAYRDAERRRQAMENLRMLGSIAYQVVKQAGSAGGSLNARTGGELLVTASKSVAASYQDELARRPDDPELLRMLAALQSTPVTKTVHAFFGSAAEGQAWCAGVQPQEMLITALQQAGARLQNMIPCRCDAVPPSAASAPTGAAAVCGIAYADAPK